MLAFFYCVYQTLISKFAEHQQEALRRRRKKDQLAQDPSEEALELIDLRTHSSSNTFNNSSSNNLSPHLISNHYSQEEDALSHELHLYTSDMPLAPSNHDSAEQLNLLIDTSNWGSATTQDQPQNQEDALIAATSNEIEEALRYYQAPDEEDEHELLGSLHNKKFQ